MRIKKPLKLNRKHKKEEKPYDPGKQFNGMVLLNGYLQRLFVYETVRRMTKNGQNDGRMEKTRSLLDSLAAIVQQFEQTKQLSGSQINDLLSTLNEVQLMMGDYLPSTSSVDFEEKLAIAVSSIYGEEHINNELIKLGELFDPEIQDRFMQRIPYYQKRVALSNRIVHKKGNNEPVSSDESAQIEEWFEDVMRNKDGIQSDFHTIRRCLIGTD